MKPRILFLDIETAPAISYHWGLWNENIGISQIIKPGYTISWAAKWAGDENVMHMDLPTNGRAEMIQGVHDLLSEADLVVHWNGTSFDIPTLNKEFIKDKLTPPAPFIEIDLLPTAKKKFKFISNKFGWVCKELGIGEKIDTGGFDLWKDFLDGKPEAFKLMKEYNIHDARLLEPVYEKFKPWIANHPNVNLWTETEDHACPHCGSTHVQSRGSYYTNTQRYKRYRCSDCGKWSRSRTNDLPKSKRATILVGAR